MLAKLPKKASLNWKTYFCHMTFFLAFCYGLFAFLNISRLDKFVVLNFRMEQNRSMKKLKLYSYFRSSTSFRVRIALNFKNLDYDYEPVHLLNNGGEQHSDLYRQLNPMGGVPTLVSGNKVLSQSAAIIQYLEDEFPQPALLPNDHFLKAKIRQFCDNINCEMHPLQNLRVLQYLSREYKVEGPQQTAWIHHWMRQGFQATETMLDEFSALYCFGDSITMADVFLAPQCVTAQRFEFPIGDYPKTSKVFDRLMEIESFQKAHPSVQPDSPPQK